ncbi:MAG TPA: GNVR domain-containing protein, partial [bacterium]|nr:GNVR domain-containing protein [bacterium]
MKILSRRIRTIRIGVLSFLLLSMAYAVFCPKTYKTVTTVKVPDAPQPATAQDPDLPTTGNNSMETYLQMAGADRVALEVIRTLNLQSDPKFSGLSMGKLVWTLQHQAIKIDNVKHSNIISIEARANAAQKAADLANAWAQSFVHLNQQLNQASEDARYQFIHGQLSSIRRNLMEESLKKENLLNPSNEAEVDQQIYKTLLQQDQEDRIRANNADTGIVVVDPAGVPDSATWPKLTLCLALGLVGGFCFGALAALLREAMENRIYDGEDLSKAAHLPLWATLPFLEAQAPTPPPLESFQWSNARYLDAVYPNCFKWIRARLLSARSETGPVALSILSAVHGEGRTLANAYLAISLAQAGKKVLLVDADIENPHLADLFDLDGGAEEFSGLLLNKVHSDTFSRPSGIPNLTLLPAGASPGLSHLLSPLALKKWIQEMKANYDYILFDTAPLLVSPDSLALCTALDGAILLARHGFTGCGQVQDVVHQLQALHVPLWGAFLNGEERIAGPWWHLGPLPFLNKEKESTQQV